MKGFVSSQLREELESNDDIQVIDNPDSTTSGAGKKKCKKRDREVMRIQMMHHWFLGGHKCCRSAVAELAVRRVL